MARLLTSLNTKTKALLALFFAVLIVLPSFDFACAAEGLSLPSASAAAATTPTAIGDQSAPVPASDSTKGLCPHGHCHPGSAVDLRADVGLALRATHAEPHFWATTPIRVSATSTRLERPPRA